MGKRARTPFRLGSLLLWLVGVFLRPGRAEMGEEQAQLGVARVTPPHEYTQKCVSGFCLPPSYEKLETPLTDTYNTVKVSRRKGKMDRTIKHPLILDRRL